VYDIAESFNGRAYRAMLEGVRQIVPQGASVLDCAAGTGELTAAAAEKADSVLCTDLSFPMLEQARKKCRKAGLKNVRFAERDITALDDSDETYDIVIAGNVLHLLDDPQVAVRELLRVTKKGGKLILPTFLINENKAAKILTGAYKLLGFDPSSNYSESDYAEMLRGFGPMKLTVLKGTIPVGFAVLKKM
ncbi:MAG: class I SAM-dependent methyltransferase, partial [Oscillospiraceae bacterium]|nr:class I SAM-dependent methyltransferase [Oscillospiraceae bacterium]